MSFPRDNAESASPCDAREGIEAVVIGTSAGALDALSALLPSLPADYALPIVIVVHLRPDRPNLIPELLQRKCAIVLSEAEDKEVLLPGHAYMAPPDYHLLIEKDKTLSLSAEEEVHFSRPSIDVLFESAADCYGASLAGVVLTGANEDGAEGLRAIVAVGGAAFVQCPDAAYARVMPEMALRACPSARIMKLEELAAALRQLGAKLQGAQIT
jgi:two-component system chemotaxis response regulator CheB